MVHFEDKGMFPKVHWSILEDSGRFLARIPRVLGLIGLHIADDGLQTKQAHIKQLHKMHVYW